VAQTFNLVNWTIIEVERLFADSVEFAEAMVTRDHNIVRVSGKLDSQQAQWVIGRCREAKKLGFTDFVLDLASCDSIFPDASVPISAFAQNWREQGLEFDLILPRDERLARLVVNSNFAHFFAPESFSTIQPGKGSNVSIRNFSTHTEHHAVSDECVAIALETVEASRDVFNGLEWSINEIMDNVITHAAASAGGFAQLTTFQDRIAFTVADCGRGILDSLREGLGWLRTDEQAVAEAIKAGVTRNPEIGQGNGLAGTLRIATMSGGSFTISSESALLTVFPQNGAIVSRAMHLPAHLSFPGTIVSAQMGRSMEFKMSEALGFAKTSGGMFDLIEKRYETSDGGALLMKMRDEKAGFGTRPSGEYVRTKIENLRAAAPGKPIVVDWEGIPVISSSFADEVFGKLFVKLGATEFASTIRNVKMEALIRGLIDKAILQRAAQSFTQPSELKIEQQTAESSPPENI
jgi:hypothetical protein